MNEIPEVTPDKQEADTSSAHPVLQKKHSLIRKIWRVIYPLLVFLGVQIICTVVIIVIYLVTVIFSKMGQTVDSVVLAQQMTDWVLSQTLLIALISDGLVIPLFAFMYLREKKGQRRPAISSFKPADYLLVAALAVVSNFAVTYIIVGFNLMQYFPDYQIIVDGLGSGSLILQIVSVGIVAPVAEEFLMRGIVLNRLLGYVRILPALLIQAALFGILHMNLLQGLYAGILGLLLGYIYIKYGSLLMTILFHITLNTFSLLLPETFGEGISPFYILIPAVLLTALTMWMISLRGSRKMFIQESTAIKAEEQIR